MTRLFSAGDVHRALDLKDALRILEEGLRATGPAAISAQRRRSDLPAEGTATVLFPGLLDAVPAYSVKVNAKFPGAVPALRGVVALHDLATGELLALLDSASITAWRTGLAAALATHLMAPGQATTAGVIGAGAQARLMVRGLESLRELERLVVFDIDPARAAAFRDEQRERSGVPVDIVTSPAEVAASAAILLLATWSKAPLLSWADLRPGTHVTSLGADEPGSVELAADVLLNSWVVVDDAELVSASGAVGNVGLGPEVIDATIGEVLTGRRSLPPETGVSVYVPIGLPWQDLALAWSVYRTSGEAGTSFDFLS